MNGSRLVSVLMLFGILSACNLILETREPPPEAFCGDGKVQWFEECDPEASFDKTCQDITGTDGNLACGTDCRFDTTGCAPLVCGNGILDDGEECDGSEFLHDCSHFGFVAGEMGCENCHMVFDSCLKAPVIGTPEMISVGADHSCMVTNQHTLYCWGSNAYGQLGIGPVETGYQITPVHVWMFGMDVLSVSAGHHFTCAVGLQNNEEYTYCWGKSDRGQAGIIDQEDNVWTPRMIDKLAHVSAGESHACAIGENDQAYCWGDNLAGQLGVHPSSTEQSSEPLLIDPAEQYKMIAAGGFHTCGIRFDSTVWCWGRNDEGQLGNNSNTFSYAPVASFGLNSITHIVSGSKHSCSMREDGEVSCWGDGSFGQIGHGSTQSSNTPKLVLLEDFVVSQMAAGGNSTCVVEQYNMTGTEIFCWGENSHGQLGDGTNENRLVPVRVNALMEGAAVSIGPHHSCGLLRIPSMVPETAYCWGRNHMGQLGNHTRADSMDPVQVAP